MVWTPHKGWERRRCKLKYKHPHCWYKLYGEGGCLDLIPPREQAAGPRGDEQAPTGGLLWLTLQRTRCWPATRQGAFENVFN
eukprot:1715155-Rhodomonas_salina.1